MWKGNLAERLKATGGVGAERAKIQLGFVADGSTLFFRAPFYLFLSDRVPTLTPSFRLAPVAVWSTRVLCILRVSFSFGNSLFIYEIAGDIVPHLNRVSQLHRMHTKSIGSYKNGPKLAKKK